MCHYVIIYVIMLCFTDTRYSFKCWWIKGQYFLVLKCPKKKSMTSVGESETGGWISSFQPRMAGHTVLEDRRNYRDETTEWKLLTRCLPRGTGERLFSPLPAANIFRARAGGFQSADTQGSWRPAGSTPASRLPQQMLPLSTVLCSRSRLLTQATHGIKKKLTFIPVEDTIHLQNTAREHNPPPVSAEQTEKFRHSLSNLCFCSFCANNHSLQGPVRWRAAHLQSVSTLFSMHQYNFWFTRVRYIYSFAINSNIRRLFLITNCGLVLKGWNQTGRDNPSWAPHPGNLQRYGSKYSGG